MITKAFSSWTTLPLFTNSFPVLRNQERLSFEWRISAVDKGWVYSKIGKGTRGAYDS